jgi:hypothetical protein
MIDRPLREPAAELTAEQIARLEVVGNDTRYDHDTGSVERFVEVNASDYYALCAMAAKSLTQAARIAELVTENHRICDLFTAAMKRAETAEAAVQVAQEERDEALKVRDSATALAEDNFERFMAEKERAEALEADLTRLQAIETAAAKLVTDYEARKYRASGSNLDDLKSALVSPAPETTQETE